MVDKKVDFNLVEAVSKDYILGKKYEKHEDMGDVFKAMQEQKIGSLKDMIDDINELIKRRQNLANEIFKDIEKIKLEINNFVIQLGTDINKGEQLNLRQKQIELEQVMVQEKVNCWRDIADLKKELRDRLVEFKEKESKATMLDKLLEE